MVKFNTRKELKISTCSAQRDDRSALEGSNCIKISE